MWSTYGGALNKNVENVFLESEVKKKINALRTYFTKELAKGPKMIAAGRKEVYVSKWPHYQSLMFLRDTINPRKIVSLPVRIN